MNILHGNNIPGFKEERVKELCLKLDKNICHSIRGYDSIYHTSNVDGEHYYYDEEGPLHGYGMGCYSDYFTLYEIDKEAYEGKYLSIDATRIGEHRGALTVFHNIVCQISDKIGKNHYILIPMTATLAELENDQSFTKNQHWQAVAIPIDCCCNNRFWFDDMQIPDNEIYEITCPSCKRTIQRKKVI